jgi:hypothetical protein
MKPGLLLLTLSLAALPAAADPTPPPRAEIPFANHGGIYDWRAEGTGSIIVESQNHHFYRATLMEPCFDLPFRDRVGFVLDARDVLDKFQAVRAGHQVCQFTSFDEIPKPDKW